MPLRPKPAALQGLSLLTCARGTAAGHSAMIDPRGCFAVRRRLALVHGASTISASRSRVWAVPCSAAKVGVLSGSDSWRFNHESHHPCCTSFGSGIQRLRSDRHLQPQADEKKLAGAALKSFTTKCERDAKAACEASAKEKKLAGAAKASFAKQCTSDASGT